MKTMWIATGLVIGIGIAATVAATADPADPSRIVPATDIVTESTIEISTTTDVEISTTTELNQSTTTVTVAIQPIAVIPATTNPQSPATTGVTTTTAYWRTIGDACSTPGAIGVSGSGVTLICTGTPSTWQSSS